MIAILAAMLLPTLHKARQKAFISTCQGNFKQIGQAVALYQADYEDYFPYPMKDGGTCYFGTPTVKEFLMAYAANNDNIFMCRFFQLDKLPTDFDYYAKKNTVQFNYFKTGSTTAPSVHATHGPLRTPRKITKVWRPSEAQYAYDAYPRKHFQGTVNEGGTALHPDGHVKPFLYKGGVAGVSEKWNYYGWDIRQPMSKY